MLHEFPGEVPFAQTVQKSVELAGFISEAPASPGRSPKVTVRRWRWRGPAVAGLCAGMSLAVALAATVSGDSPPAPVSPFLYIFLAREPTAPAPPVTGPVPGQTAAVAGGGTNAHLRDVVAVAASPLLFRQPASAGVPPPTGVDETLVRSVLERYRGAYERLDPDAAKMIPPSLDDVESQSMQFDDCRIDIDSGRAVASCRGQATYVTHNGDRSTRTEPRTWTFELHNDGVSWTIDSVQSH